MFVRKVTRVTERPALGVMLAVMSSNSLVLLQTGRTLQASMASSLFLIVALGADVVVVDIHTPFVSAKVHDCEALLRRLRLGILLLAKLQPGQRQTERIWLRKVSLVSGQDMIPINFFRLVLIGRAEASSPGISEDERGKLGFKVLVASKTAYLGASFSAPPS